MVLWLTGHPTHLAGRSHIVIEPLAVLTAVSYRTGGDVGRGWEENIAVRWSETHFKSRAVVAKRQSYWTAFSTLGDRFLKESRAFRG